MYNKYLKYKIKYLKAISLNQIGGIRGIGFQNIRGYTCYMNAALQLFFRMSNLIDFIKSDKVIKTPLLILLLNIYDKWYNSEIVDIDVLKKNI